MRDHDPNLRIQLENAIAEVGASFGCTITRSPSDGEFNDDGIGHVRAVRLTLRMTTEGRGDTDAKDYVSVEIPVDEFGMATAQTVLDVPPDAPISYDGTLIQVRWEIEARTDIRMAIDQRSTASVLVVPVGGLGTYDRPHPLINGEKSGSEPEAL